MAKVELVSGGKKVDGVFVPKKKSEPNLVDQLGSTVSQAKALGIDTSKAESMLAQTMAQGSSPYAGSSYEKEYNNRVIPLNALEPTPPLAIPQFTPLDPGNVVAPNSMTLAGASNGAYTYDANTGQLAVVPKDPSQTLFEQMLGAQQKNFEELGNGADRLAKLEKQYGLQQKEQAVNALTTQLNSITAKAQADQLRLEGQGRGITDVIIGGQQAQINREAAIAALPVQAQLAAAQGDLALAQSHIDKMYQIQSQDAQARFQFKASVIQSVYEFADKQEQRKLDEKREQEARAYAEQQDFLKTQNNLLSMAVQQGAPQSVVSLISNAKTTQEAIAGAGEWGGDRLARQAQLANIEQSRAATANSYDQIRARKAAEQMAQAEAQAQAQAQAQGANPQDSLDNLAFLRNTTAKAFNLSGASGAPGISKKFGDVFVGATQFRQLETYADTLRTNVLSLMTDPNIKKFFGPQMSNADVRLMTSAGTTLRPDSQTPEQIREEVQRLDNLFSRMQKAVQAGMANSANVIVAPDGQKIQIID